jgi:hypothetical protein
MVAAAILDFEELSPFLSYSMTLRRICWAYCDLDVERMLSWKKAQLPEFN